MPLLTETMRIKARCSSWPRLDPNATPTQRAAMAVSEKQKSLWDGEKKYNNTIGTAKKDRFQCDDDNIPCQLMTVIFSKCIYRIRCIK